MLRVELAEALSLAALRLVPGVSILESPDCVWARGDILDESIDLALRKLPAERFSIVDQHKLLRPGAQIPLDSPQLASREWVPITSWLSPAPQPAALTGIAPAKIPLRWESSTDCREAGVLIAPAPTLRRWATGAAEVRLRPLRFALSTSAMAVIHGVPLPPIAGKRLVEHSGIAWPAGLAPRPAIDPPALRDLLQLQPGDLALFDADGSYALIEAGDFIPLTRAALRASLTEVAR